MLYYPGYSARPSFTPIPQYTVAGSLAYMSGLPAPRVAGAAGAANGSHKRDGGGGGEKGKKKKKGHRSRGGGVKKPQRSRQTRERGRRDPRRFGQKVRALSSTVCVNLDRACPIRG